MCFDSILPLHQLLLNPFHSPPYPTLCSVSLSKNKLKPKRKKYSKTKNNKMCTKNMEVIK